MTISETTPGETVAEKKKIGIGFRLTEVCLPQTSGIMVPYTSITILRRSSFTAGSFANLPFHPVLCMRYLQFHEAKLTFFPFICRTLRPRIL